MQFVLNILVISFIFPMSWISYMILHYIFFFRMRLQKDSYIIIHLKLQTVASMSAGQRKALLFFWTSLKNLPVEGFGGLTSRLYIYKVSESCNRLPTSQTCFYQLCFPPYQSLKVMQDRLSLITQDHVGCSFGTSWEQISIQSLFQNQSRNSFLYYQIA